MTIDYYSEMSNVLVDANAIPEWFGELPVEDRTTIIGSALSEYVDKTSSKNSSFLIFRSNLLEPYTP